MCGHLHYKPAQLSASELLETLRKYRDIILPILEGSFYPGSMVDIILNDGTPRAQSAIWWFLIDDKTGKPNYKYATFNARNLQNRTWKQPLKTNRCLILATAFAETSGEGKDKRSYLLESEAVFLLGGLYRINHTPSGPLTSFAVITCNPHPRLKQYHEKSCPFFLPLDQSIVDTWLDPNIADIPLIHDLIEHPRIPTNFVVTPVNTTKKLQPVGEPEWLEADT